MARYPVSDEVAAALGAFVAGGIGPKHSTLSRLFVRTGYQAAAPYNPNSPAPQMNKEDRVRVTVSAAVREPARSQELIEGLLAEYRVYRFFEADTDPVTDAARRRNVQTARQAFARIDWELTGTGELRPAGVGAVSALEGRPAIEEQLNRLRRAADDPPLLLGTAKEMLESTAKYVLEEFAVPYTARTSFDELWFHARERLRLLPQAIEPQQSGSTQVREILQASWAIARMTNEVRNMEGTGHGRTLPTAMSADLAMLVVREACSVAQMVLSTLDRQLGR